MDGACPLGAAWRPEPPLLSTHWVLNPSTPCQVVCHLASHSRRHDCPRCLMPRLLYAVVWTSWGWIWRGGDLDKTPHSFSQARVVWGGQPPSRHCWHLRCGNGTLLRQSVRSVHHVAFVDLYGRPAGTAQAQGSLDRSPWGGVAAAVWTHTCGRRYAQGRCQGSIQGSRQLCMHRLVAVRPRSPAAHGVEYLGGRLKSVLS